jgi:hypothetical protein
LFLRALCYNDITTTIEPTSNQVWVNRFFTKDAAMSDLAILRELYEAKFNAQEAKIEAVAIASARADDRQDEAIERLAERTTHAAETKRLTERVQELEAQTDAGETRRLTERVQKLENQIDAGRNRLNDHDYKIKVIWAAGGSIAGLLLAMLAAIIKGWIGV